jgi:hypothetical protein
MYSALDTPAGIFRFFSFALTCFSSFVSFAFFMCALRVRARRSDVPRLGGVNELNTAATDPERVFGVLLSRLQASRGAVAPSIRRRRECSSTYRQPGLVTLTRFAPRYFLNAAR